MNASKSDTLLALSHALGREDRHLAILGEGNTSVKTGEFTFLVKASGSSLATLSATDVVECDARKLFPLFDPEAEVSDENVDQILFSSRLHPEAKKPSVESLFHAWLLSLPGVAFVAHAHPVSVNQILCSPRAREFADHRLFPDEIVCCGIASVFVPYVDPGLALARAIRQETEKFISLHERPPQLILLQNHGAITVGPTADSVLAAMRMAEKAASIFLGAAALGGPIFLSRENVARIAGRPDEHYRRRALNL